MTEIDVEFVEEIDDADEEGDGSDIEAPEYVLYGGKGGVGKTTMAAATALASAREGVPTLVVSTDPAHSLSDVLDREVPDEPAEVHAKHPLYAVEIDPGDRDETADFFGIGSPLAGFGPFGGGGIGGGNSEGSGGSERSGIGGFDAGSDPFGAPMPGADEAAALRALLRYLDDERFERIVVDTAPTGHTLRLLELPDRLDATLDRVLSFRERLEGMFSGFSGSDESGFGGLSGFPGFGEAGGFGPAEGPTGTDPGTDSERDDTGATGAGDDTERSFGPDSGIEDLRELSDRLEALDEAFSDPDRTDFRIVIVPEKTSVVESRRLLDRLAAFDIPVGTIVVNRVMEDIGTVLDVERKSTTREDENEGNETTVGAQPASDDRAGDTNGGGEDGGHVGNGGDDSDTAEGGAFVAPRPDSCPFCRRRLRSQMDALGDADDLFRGRTVKRVPLLGTEIRGEKLLNVVAACLV